jgi:outer membrane protein OmpA-like peptidoglycan-associated protein
VWQELDDALSFEAEEELDERLLAEDAAAGPLSTGKMIRAALPVFACQKPSRQVVSGYPAYQSSVSSLPKGEQDKIKESARLIDASYQPGCDPIVQVGLVGHADRGGKNDPTFDKRISNDRAVAVRQALQGLIKNPKAVSLIKWEVVAAGSGSLLVPNPRTEPERARNRRVEIFPGPIPVDGRVIALNVDGSGASIRLAQGLSAVGELTFDLYSDPPGPSPPLVPRTEWMRRGAMLGLAQRAFTGGDRVKLTVAANNRVLGIEVYKPGPP